MIPHFFVFLCLLVTIFTQTSLSWAQGYSTAGLTQSEGFKDSQQRYSEILGNQSSVLKEFSQRLSALQKEIQIIVQKYRDGQISRDEAYEEIKPLVEKEWLILESKEYQVEQTILGLLAVPAAAVSRR